MRYILEQDSKHCGKWAIFDVRDQIVKMNDLVLTDALRNTVSEMNKENDSETKAFISSTEPITCTAINPRNSVQCGLPIFPRHRRHQNGTKSESWE